MSQQSLKDPQVTAAISLAPIQLAGIVVGTMLASVFLSFAVGIVLIRARNKEKRGFVKDKDPALDPKIPLSRNSMDFRPGNSVVIRFSPPTSAYDFPPAPERHESLSATPSALMKETVPKATVWDEKGASNNFLTSRIDEWPLTASFNDTVDGTSNEIWSQTTMSTPHNMSAQNTEPTPDPSPARDFSLNNSRNDVSTIIFSSTPGPVVIETSQELGLNEDSWSIHEPTQESSYELDAKKKSDKLTPLAEEIEDPFKDPVMELDESFIEGFSGDLVEQPSEQPTETSSNTLADDGHLEDAVDPETRNSWNNQDDTPLEESVEALVACEVEDLMPQPGPSSPIVVASSQKPSEPNLADQGETTNQRTSIHSLRTTSPGKVREHVPEMEDSSGIQVIAIQTLPDSRDATPPPLRQNPTVGFPERRVESQSPDAEKNEREISPLRRNPPFEPFEAIISLLDGPKGGATKLEEDADEYESRGRSMIRTSDIIEARLSGLAQANKPQEDMLQPRGRQGEPDDLQPASSAPAQRSTATDQVQLRTPPKRKPVAANQVSTKNPPSLSSNSLSRPVSATSATVTPRRDESSPLRRNPPDINPPPRRALGTGAKATSSTKEFSQALSKFQTLISENPQDAVVASNEVTSRAIAGIYIPGSLREQAVRNLSKSRERGNGERQRK